MGRENEHWTTGDRKLWIEYRTRLDILAESLFNESALWIVYKFFVLMFKYKSTKLNITEKKSIFKVLQGNVICHLRKQLVFYLTIKRHESMINAIIVPYKIKLNSKD